MKIIKQLKETNADTGDVVLTYTVEDGTSFDAAIGGDVVQDMAAMFDIDAVAELEAVLRDKCTAK
jgi:hypothetical protein